MINLDIYLEGHEAKLEEIQSGIVYVKSYKKPKIRITRLSEERKFVPVELDIEINENLVIKDRFDWNLNDETVSVEDFINELCDTLKLPEINRSRLKASLIYQVRFLFSTILLIDYIERNTYYPRAKPKDAKAGGDDEDGGQDGDPANKEATAATDANSTAPLASSSNASTAITSSSTAISSSSSGMNNRFYGYQTVQKEQEEDQKKTARQRRLDELKKVTSSSIQPSGKASYIRDKRSCKNCNYVNNTPSFECKKCKVAFYLLDMVDLSQCRVAQAVQYYQIIASYFPLLSDYVKDYSNILTSQNFESMLTLKIALKQIFPTMKELTESNIRLINEKLEDVFANFLTGVVVLRSEEILPQKRRGRKPKSWYEEQDRIKREKQERKALGEVVSSDDDLDEDDESNEDEFYPQVRKQQGDNNAEGNEAGLGGASAAMISSTAQADKEAGGAGGDEDDDEDGSQSSIVVRRGRGRPPKKSNYIGKKRGRKPKGQTQDSNAKNRSNGDGDSEMQNEDDQAEQTGKGDEEEVNEEVAPPKSSRNHFDDGDDDRIQEDDEDDEDYDGGTTVVVKKGKRGRPPKNQSKVASTTAAAAAPTSSQTITRRGRKPAGTESTSKQIASNDEKGENEEVVEGDDKIVAEEDELPVPKKPVKPPTGNKRGRPRKIIPTQEEIKPESEMELEEEIDQAVAGGNESAANGAATAIPEQVENANEVAAEPAQPEEQLPVRSLRSTRQRQKGNEATRKILQLDDDDESDESDSAYGNQVRRNTRRATKPAASKTSQKQEAAPEPSEGNNKDEGDSHIGVRSRGRRSAKDTKVIQQQEQQQKQVDESNPEQEEKEEAGTLAEQKLSKKSDDVKEVASKALIEEEQVQSKSSKANKKDQNNKIDQEKNSESKDENQQSEEIQKEEKSNDAAEDAIEEEEEQSEEVEAEEEEEQEDDEDEEEEEEGVRTRRSQRPSGVSDKKVTGTPTKQKKIQKQKVVEPAPQVLGSKTRGRPSSNAASKSVVQVVSQVKTRRR